MQTITIDIINDKAIALLEDLEKLELIHMHVYDEKKLDAEQRISRFKGAMTKQSREEIDKQLSELRKAWD